MKIKTKRVSYDHVENLKPNKRKKLPYPNFLFRTLVRLLSIPELTATKFTYEKKGMEKIGKKEPCLILMNHSSFLDLKLASKIFYPKPYYIVSTTDGFVGKEWLMRRLGCIPTKKFVPDVNLVRNMARALQDKKTSVLLFPEAGYTFDGKKTALPKSLGGVFKKLGVPIVTVITDGAFLYQPLYNNLRIRKTKVSAKVECLVSKEELAEKTPDEINELLEKAFSFDGFRSQKEKGVKVADPDRAEGLERILYRCPACEAEGKTVGKGVTLTCQNCGKTYTMDEFGQMNADNGDTEFPLVTDWTAWERNCVRKQLERGEYRMELSVDIGVIADTKAMYMVGTGKLVHDENGFSLTSDDKKLFYTQAPVSSYTLNSDFFWYEMDDIIGIGDNKRLYYCFLQGENVAYKARLATEELYKICMEKKNK